VLAPVDGFQQSFQGARQREPGIHKLAQNMQLDFRARSLRTRPE
jgi:hypothetical protein